MSVKHDSVTDCRVIGNISGKTEQVVHGNGRFLERALVVGEKGKERLIFIPTLFSELDLNNDGMRRMLKEAFSIIIVDEDAETS